MKKLFKYEINESVAAKAAMNCVHKRLFKELYALGSPMPQEEVARGEYDPYEWEFDDYGNEDKRHLVLQALVQAGLIQSEEEGLSLNNKIQQILDKTNFSVSNEQDAMKFVKAYGQQIVGETQEQEEENNSNDNHGIKMIMDIMIANRLMSNDPLSRQIAWKLIQRKLNEEGMWIGDDKAKAEEFVSSFGEDLEEEIAYWRW